MTEEAGPGGHSPGRVTEHSHDLVQHVYGHHVGVGEHHLVDAARRGLPDLGEGAGQRLHLPGRPAAPRPRLPPLQSQSPAQQQLPATSSAEPWHDPPQGPQPHPGTGTTSLSCGSSCVYFSCRWTQCLHSTCLYVAKELAQRLSRPRQVLCHWTTTPAWVASCQDTVDDHRSREVPSTSPPLLTPLRCIHTCMQETRSLTRTPQTPGGSLRSLLCTCEGPAGSIPALPSPCPSSLPRPLH